MNPGLARAIRDANRRVFDAKNFDEYERNPSIFEPARQEAIRARLAAAAARGRARILDVGCGTGNVLRLAAEHFDACVGADISPGLLGELRRRQPRFRLSVAEAERLPFRTGAFDLVTLYGVLHHLLAPDETMSEAARILRPGGMLYVDHDPNYFFGRFFRVFYRLRHAWKPGFGDDDTEMSEWHNSRTGGLNADAISARLKRIGFARVDVEYRLTTNPNLDPLYKAVRAGMRAAARILPWKSLYTHFSIVAIRG